MGWTEGYFNFPGKESKETIMKEVNESLYQERGSYEPRPQKYLFLTKEPFENEKAAKEYLDSAEMSKYWRNTNVAVQYYDTVEGKITKKMEDLERRIKETEDKTVKYASEHAVSKFKADFIGCPECKSKIAKRFISSSDRCPLCHADLRSETTIKTMNGYYTKIKQLQKQLAEEKKKTEKKGTICWLVYAQLYLG